MAHAIVNTDMMTGTTQSVALRSFKLFGGSGRTDANRIDVDNGNIVTIKELLEGQREIFAAEAPKATDKIQDIVLVATVEMMYDERKRNLDEFYNAKEDVNASRGYHLVPNAEFSATAEAFENASPTIGQVVEITDGSTKLGNVATLTSGSTQIGKIIDEWVTGTKTYYTVKCNF